MGLHLEALADLVGDDFDLDFDEGFELHEAHDARPLRAGDEHLHAGGRLPHAVDFRNGADRVKILFDGVVHLRVLLRDQQDLFVFIHCRRDRGDRGPAADRQGHDQLGKDDVVPQGHEG